MTEFGFSEGATISTANDEERGAEGEREVVEAFLVRGFLKDFLLDDLRDMVMMYSGGFAELFCQGSGEAAVVETKTCGGWDYNVPDSPRSGLSD